MLSWIGKIFALVTVAAVLVLLFWDLSPPPPNDGKLHIRYWSIVGMKDVTPYYVTSFNASQPHTTADVTLIPWQEHEKKILTAVLSGDPPDVVLQVTPVAKWASRMALMPLDDYIRRDNFDSTVFFPSLWDEMRWQGSIFAVPVYSGSYAFFYNKRLFREAGLDPESPPRTWDEVWALNDRFIQRDGEGRITRLGFIPTYGNLQASLLMAWQLGAKFLSPDGLTVHLNTPEMVEGFRWLLRFYRSYPLKDVAAFTGGFGFADQHGFIAEKVAMMVLDSSFPDQIKAYKPALEFGVAMIPSCDGKPSASASGSWWLAIPRGAKNPGAAWEFIKHAVTKEAQLKEIEMTEESLFPASSVAAHDPRFMNSKERTIFVRMMDYAHSPSIVPVAHDVFWREFFGAQEKVIYGLQTPEEALKERERVVQGVLTEALEYDAYVRSRMGFR